MIVIYFLLAFVLYSLYYFSTWKFNYWKKRNVVGPKPVPFFGNLKDSTLRRRTVGMLLKEFHENYSKEKVVGIFRMTSPCLLVRDPEIIKHIMIKDFDMFADRGVRLSKDGLGLNLFHSDEDTWRVLRNKFTPLFTSGKLKNMLYLMTESGEKFVNYVSNAIKERPEQNVFILVQHYTMATIAACAFGLELNVHEQLKTLQELDKQIFTLTYAQELDFIIPGILAKIGGSLFPKKVKYFFNDLVKSVIAERNGKPTNRKDFMDLILELKQAGSVQGSKIHADKKTLELDINDDVIAAQAFVFYAGGYETSATTMGFLLYQLAQNPEMQDKVVEEINDVLEKHDGKITYETIVEMKYMDQVFAETLRMYPLVDSLQRCVKADYKVPGTDLTIEKEQIVIVSPLGLHYDPQYYPNPETFDPERFSPKNSKIRHPCTYVPFGIGPRNCIGMRFAQVQSRVCLINLLKNFKVECTKNTKKHLIYDPYRIVLAPLSGIYLSVVPRK